MIPIWIQIIGSAIILAFALVGLYTMYLVTKGAFEDWIDEKIEKAIKKVRKK